MLQNIFFFALQHVFYNKKVVSLFSINTALKFEFVDFRHVEELEKPILIINQILPF